MFIMNDEKENLFTFVWKIENWEMKIIRNNHKFRSPTFSIKKFLNTSWYLELSYNMEKNKLECCLSRLKDSEGPNEIKINYKIVGCHNSDEPFNFEISQIAVFKKGSLILSWDFFNDVILDRPNEIECFIICQMSIDANKVIRHILNPKDAMLFSYLNLSLTTMENLKSEFVHTDEYKYLQKLHKIFFRFSNVCFAKTVVLTEKNTFMWSLEQFLNTKEYIYMTEFSNFPDFLIKMYTTEGNKINIQIESKASITGSYVISGVLWISEFEKNICSQLIGDVLDSKKSILKETLNTENVFPGKRTFDGKLYSLHLEIKISIGNVFSYIQSTSPVNFLNLNESYNNQANDNLRIKMENMYSDKLFCDVTLQLPRKKFEAHKAVLCTNSPVFKAMFENKMQENKKNVIVIDDMDENTIDHMLKFMYSDILEDLLFDETLKLYEASDKYEILPLQKKCALKLRSNITVKNALILLSLFDVHSDKDLKSFVVKFIVLHIREILVLEDWKIFSKGSILLANEILEKVCMKFTGLNELKHC